MEQKRINFFKKWQGKPLEDWGSVMSDEYRGFERSFKNILKYIASEIGANLVWFHPMHYDESAMFERNGKYVYLMHSNNLFNRSTPELNHMLIRTAEHSEDYHGGSNNYSNWATLTNDIDRLLGGRGEIETVDKFPFKQIYGE